jgi:hypothetical protein
MCTVTFPLPKIRDKRGKATAMPVQSTKTRSRVRRLPKYWDSRFAPWRWFNHWKERGALVEAIAPPILVLIVTLN